MIFCRKFSSLSTKKIHRDTLLFFRKFLVSKKLMDRRGGGEYHDFQSEMLCLTVPKEIVQESFSVSLIRVSKNFRH